MNREPESRVTALLTVSSCHRSLRSGSPPYDGTEGDGCEEKGTRWKRLILFILFSYVLGHQISRFPSLFSLRSGSVSLRSSFTFPSGHE